MAPKRKLAGCKCYSDIPDIIRTVLDYAEPDLANLEVTESFDLNTVCLLMCFMLGWHPSMSPCEQLAWFIDYFCGVALFEYLIFASPSMWLKYKSVFQKIRRNEEKLKKVSRQCVSSFFLLSIIFQLFEYVSKSPLIKPIHAIWGFLTQIKSYFLRLLVLSTFVGAVHWGKLGGTSSALLRWCRFTLQTNLHMLTLEPTHLGFSVAMRMLQPQCRNSL